MKPMLLRPDQGARRGATPLLTERQTECLVYLAAYFDEHARYPTHREIAAALGVQSTTAAVHLEPLLRKGALRRIGRGHRKWRITALGEQLLGQAGAGFGLGAADQHTAAREAA